MPRGAKGAFSVALFALSFLSACIVEVEEVAESPPPSVLLVVLDTVRADRVSSYGYGRPTTPQIDAVAESGVLFEQASAAAPWTWPSHASLFTGEPPWVHGAHLVSGGGEAHSILGMSVSPMRADLPTLAERFSAAGYRSVAAVANDWLGPELGLTRGFDPVEVFESDREVVARAVEEIGRSEPRPLFLFVNLLSAHTPFRSGPGPWAVRDPASLSPEGAPDWLRPYLTPDAPPGVHLATQPEGHEADGVSRYIAGDLDIPDSGLALLSHLYDAGVRAADFSFGRILAKWVERHPDGIVVVTSDHGEALGEHGALDHRASVYPEVLHVPLVLAAPGRAPAGLRVREPVQLQDLAPTLLDVAGIESSPRSLIPRVGAPRERTPVRAAAWPHRPWAEQAGGRYRHQWRLYRDGDHALVWSDAGHIELYDLRMDPGMFLDIALREPVQARALLARAERDFADLPEAAREPMEIPEETRERLRGLGYLGD